MSAARVRLARVSAPGLDQIAPIVVAVFVFLALCGALVLVTVSVRRPRTVPLLVAGGLVALCLVVVAVLPWRLSPVVGAVIALLAVALATFGGDPFVRWVLSIADGGKTAEGDRGGILVELMADRGTTGGAPRQEEILRGGTTIGYLERVAAALSIVAGFPAAIAVLVALKGIGRFSELATPAARERFIVGTLASLLWACAVAGIVPLALA